MKVTQYVLLCLAEEANEVAHAVSKVLRFTPDDSAITGGPSNMETLQKEYNDFLAVAELLSSMSIPLQRDPVMVEMKKKRLLEYMDYSEKLGVVEVLGGTKDACAY